MAAFASITPIVAVFTPVGFAQDAPQNSDPPDEDTAPVSETVTGDLVVNKDLFVGQNNVGKVFFVEIKVGYKAKDGTISENWVELNKEFPYPKPNP